MKYLYKLDLGLRFPKKDKPIDFTNYTEKIKDSINSFNDVNSEKFIELYNILPSSIILNLHTNKIVARPLREISYISKYLSSTLGMYSEKEGKLFKPLSMIQLENQSHCETMNITNTPEKSLSIIEGIQALVLSKDFGIPERIEAKHIAIEKINEILKNIL